MTMLLPLLQLHNDRAHCPCSYAQRFWQQCAVGFSGVVFGLVVVDNQLSGAASRSILGFFTVPAKAYPWALVVFWQLLVPQASFLGHLAGVLVRSAPHGADCPAWTSLSLSGGSFGLLARTAPPGAPTPAPTCHLACSIGAVPRCSMGAWDDVRCVKGSPQGRQSLRLVHCMRCATCMRDC